WRAESRFCKCTPAANRSTTILIWNQWHAARRASAAPIWKTSSTRRRYFRRGITAGPLTTNRWTKRSIGIAGPQKRTQLMSDHEKQITAYHEGGHALVAAALPNSDPVHKITILPRGRALGYTMVLPDQDKYSQTRGEMLDKLAY